MCGILWPIFIFVHAIVAGWKVCRYCGIGRASIIVILLIRHRFAKKMSMKEQDLVMNAAFNLKEEVARSNAEDNTICARKNNQIVLH